MKLPNNISLLYNAEGSKVVVSSKILECFIKLEWFCIGFDRSGLLMKYANMLTLSSNSKQELLPKGIFCQSLIEHLCCI